MGEPQTINIVKISSSISIVLLLITVLAGTIMVNTSVSADETLPTDTDYATASVNVCAACSMSGGNNTYTKSITPGNTIEINPISSGTTPEGNAIKAVCNDPGGFGLYAIGYSGDSYTSSTHTDLIASSAGTTNNIHTATSGGSSNDSYWAMKLSSVSGNYTPTIENSYNTYQVVPANFTKVASLNKATDLDNTTTTPTTATEGSSVYATYKVGASSTQVADTYTGKVKYVLVHPGSMVAGTYTIAFNANGGTGSMANQTTSSTGGPLYNFEEQTLNQMSGITAPDGYKFAGWCDVQDQTASGVVPGADPQTTCTGTSYADQGTVLPSVAAANSTYTLYAMWEEPMSFDKAFANAGKTKYNNYYKMQDASGSICTAVDEGETTTLIDVRGDNQTYSVAKLADDKCWMTENLNLAGGTALSADDTNVTSAYISSFSTSNNLTKSGDTIVLPASSTSGFNTNNYSYVYNSGNKTNCGASGQNTPCYSYYSWDAATLGSGRSISTDNTNAEQSICPKGWKLPSTYNGTDSSTDFRALMIGYGGSNSVQTYNTSTSPTGATMYSSIGPGSTPNFLLAGYYGNGSFYVGGSYGYYWSSTSDSRTSTARNLYFNSAYVNSAVNNYRRSGYSVRCFFSE